MATVFCPPFVRVLVHIVPDNYQAGEKRILKIHVVFGNVYAVVRLEEHS